MQMVQLEKVDRQRMRMSLQRLKNTIYAKRNTTMSSAA